MRQAALCQVTSQAYTVAVLLLGLQRGVMPPTVRLLHRVLIRLSTRFYVVPLRAYFQNSLAAGLVKVRNWSECDSTLCCLSKHATFLGAAEAELPARQQMLQALLPALVLFQT